MPLRQPLGGHLVALDRGSLAAEPLPEAEPPSFCGISSNACRATISALATAGGTLVLAGATFASVRSANRAARVAEQSLLVGLRPLLIPSRFDDPPQKTIRPRR